MRINEIITKHLRYDFCLRPLNTTRFSDLSLTFLSSQFTQLVEGFDPLSTTDQWQSIWSDSQSVGIFDVTWHGINLAFQVRYRVVLGSDYSLRRR